MKISFLIAYTLGVFAFTIGMLQRTPTTESQSDSLLTVQPVENMIFAGTYASQPTLPESFSLTAAVSSTSATAETLVVATTLSGAPLAGPAAVVATTPTPVPTPTATPVPLPPSTWDAAFALYGEAYGVDPEKLKRMAKCESGFRQDAVNGPYGGMFQFSAATWSSIRKAMGEDPNPELRFIGEEAIKTTAWKIAHGGVGAWPHCGKL